MANNYNPELAIVKNTSRVGSSTLGCRRVKPRRSSLRKERYTLPLQGVSASDATKMLPTATNHGILRLDGVLWKLPDSGVAFSPLKVLLPGYHGVASFQESLCVIGEAWPSQ